MEPEGLMMELEGGDGNSVLKRRNPIEFGLVSFILTRTLVLDDYTRLNPGSDHGIGRWCSGPDDGAERLSWELYYKTTQPHQVLWIFQGLKMELKGSQSNSVIKLCNPIEFGFVCDCRDRWDERR
ncbi:hypothetical protein EVAR_51660_1 [Eumeta japonica]|uniref:Uncharacterized protein n=1 Tax=Eumeta variegata TaxID=151549 RepID=A0A4C1YGT2_EUMVA|nr:hypothetical protein EVAR_51660_1 [Eumeta japonica]